jgi:hypothetical protein
MARVREYLRNQVLLEARSGPQRRLALVFMSKDRQRGLERIREYFDGCRDAYEAWFDSLDELEIE